jgi:hypothetical protein
VIFNDLQVNSYKLHFFADLLAGEFGFCRLVLAFEVGSLICFGLVGGKIFSRNARLGKSDFHEVPRIRAKKTI